MKMLRCLLLSALLVAAPIVCASAQVVWHHPQTGIEVCSVDLQEEEWLFLPSCADLNHLTITVEDQAEQTLDWLSAAQPSESIPDAYDVCLDDGTALHVMKSDALRSVHLISHDEQTDREWLEASPDHSRYALISMAIVDAEGRMNAFDGEVTIRGRGNNTWLDSSKKPYQIKLSRKEDLLGTGLWQEACRTWVLLSNERDDTMLLNQLALDMGKELGLESTSRCEQVDLYYDGNYRGTYLLCEKIEVASHSVDIYDLDEPLQKINHRLGVSREYVKHGDIRRDGETPVPSGKNAFGLDYAHADGVYDYQQVQDGGYLLELEGYSSLSTHAWFQLSNGQYMGVKHPQYAGKSMMLYISELFENAFQTLMNFGFHPETGEPLENFIDVDSFAKSLLMHEFLPSIDGYRWASTFFVLPEGETRFQAGPLWDFDRLYEKYATLKDGNDFSYAFQRTTAFQRAAKKICSQQFKPMLENILLGTENGRYLRPLSAYQQQLRRSWMMNYLRHSASSRSIANIDRTFESVMKNLEKLLVTQGSFLLEEVAAWSEDEPTLEVDLLFDLPYADTTCINRIRIENEPHGSLYLKDVKLTCLQEATQESFAVWRADFVIAAKPGCRIEPELEVRINGEAAQGERTQTEVRISVLFEDPSYRPAILDGVDYGHVFNYDYYLENAPEAGEDFESALRTFRDEGMDYGEMGNEFFDPIQMLEHYTYLTDEFGGDWRLYYEIFMESPADWMLGLDNIYQPEWTECPPADPDIQ